MAVLMPMLSYVGPWSNDNELFDISIAILFALLMLSLREFIDRNAAAKIIRALSFIGLISFSMYLYNYLVYIPIKLFMDIPVISWVSPLLVIIVVGWLGYIAIEKNVNVVRKKLISSLKGRDS